MFRRMQIELEPSEYAVRGRKEPILHPRWWVGVLTLVGIIVVGTLTRPLFSAWLEWATALLASW